MTADPGYNQAALHVMMGAAEGTDFSADAGAGVGGDHFSHAAGRICVTCDRQIEARQPARRRGENGWAHDVCPEF